MKLYLSPAEIAECLGIDVGKVTAWCKSGELRTRNVARSVGRKARWRILQSDLDAFLDRRANSPPVKPARRRKPTEPTTTWY
jgi:excisionase family DNA binding protein